MLGSACLVALLLGSASVKPASPVAKESARAAKSQLLEQAPELVSAVQALGEPVALTKSERAQLRAIASSEKKGQHAVALSKWKALVRARAEKDDAQATNDIDALVMLVLRQAYLDTDKSLSQYAAKAAWFNEQKAELREHMMELRDHLREHTSADDTFALREIVITKTFAPGTKPVTWGPSRTRTVAQWRSVLDELERAYQRLGQDAELMQLDLHRALSKHQEAVVLMSNLSKSLHDTAKALIDNMRG